MQVAATSRPLPLCVGVHLPQQLRQGRAAAV